MADTPTNPKVTKLANGLYTVRDYQPPKEVRTGDLRKLADIARQVIIQATKKAPA